MQEKDQSRSSRLVMRHPFIFSGILCDGAKISCAAKIATSIDAGMMAHFLAMNGKEYEAFTGILKEECEETISCVGYIGKVGMRETDREIVKLMLTQKG